MISCSPATETQAPETIRKFYVEYIGIFNQFPPDFARLGQLKEANCTAEFQSRLANMELDSDPFLNLQDVDENLASTLKVSSIDTDPNLFNVCMELAYDHSTHCVQVKVEDVDGQWKIADVLH